MAQSPLHSLFYQSLAVVAGVLVAGAVLFAAAYCAAFVAKVFP